MTAEAVLQNIGSIVVSIVRIQPVHEHDQIDGFQARGLPDIGPVNERSKKAGSHCVSYVCIVYPMQSWLLTSTPLYDSSSQIWTAPAMSGSSEAQC